MKRFIHTFAFERDGERITKLYDTSNADTEETKKWLSKVFRNKNFHYVSVTSYTEEPYQRYD